MLRKIQFAIFLAMAVVVPTSAYELGTHKGLTEAAANRSVLRLDSSVLRNLGLDKPIDDLTQTFPNTSGKREPILDLLKNGAEREDDILPLPPRVLFHFYNPLTGEGLSRNPFIPQQRSSPAWALSPRGSISAQTFSFADARQYMLDALTKQSKTERELAFGRMFQTIGHVVHHVQDMAQPQHVRNDIHCPYPACTLLNAHAPSLFEFWTELDSVRPSLLQRFTDPGSVGYDITSPTFSTTYNIPHRFWHTEPPGPNSPATGKGMAEFTNSNFVSAGTNFDKPRQPSPPYFELPAFDSLRRSTVSIGELCKNQSPPCSSDLTSPPIADASITFYGTLGRDNFLGTHLINPRASSESIFDEQLRVRGERPVFALNRFNFEEAYKQLLPRAVAFSAGLINYFFRGKLEVEGQGATQILVKNATAEAIRGDFGLYYDDAGTVRRPVTITACRVGDVDVAVENGTCKAAALAASSANPALPLQVTFVPPVSPAQKSPGEYLVVFNGDLGEEKAGPGNIGAVAAKQIRTVGEALYIRAYDNLGNIVNLKADASGTREVKIGAEFFPLNPFSESSTAYSMRQVKFTQTGPGVYGYEPIALTVTAGFPNPQSRFAYVKNSVTNTFDLAAQGISEGDSWLAKSTPEIGEFTFTVRRTQGNLPDLRYKRRFRDATGNIVTEDGVLTLPPSVAGNPLSLGRLQVFGDGVRIAGFAAPSAAARAQLYYEGRITLGLTPSINFVETHRDAREFSNDVQTENKPIGTVSTTPPECPCCPGTGIPLTGDLNRISYRRVASERTEVTTQLGIINDQIPTFKSTFTLSFSAFGERVDGRLFRTSGAPSVCPDWILSVTRGSVHEQGESTAQTTFVDRTWTFSASGVGGDPADKNNPLNVLFPGLMNKTWDYSYEGESRNSPPLIYQNLPRSGSSSGERFEYSIERLLTEKFADAIVRPPSSICSGCKLFRNHDITGKSYVADVSPLGEIFFATADMQIIVHEPKGSTPRIVLPPRVVRIIGAVWF